MPTGRHFYGTIFMAILISFGQGYVKQKSNFETIYYPIRV